MIDYNFVQQRVPARITCDGCGQDTTGRDVNGNLLAGSLTVVRGDALRHAETHNVAVSTTVDLCEHCSGMLLQLVRKVGSLP